MGGGASNTAFIVRLGVHTPCVGARGGGVANQEVVEGSEGGGGSLPLRQMARPWL